MAETKCCEWEQGGCKSKNCLKATSNRIVAPENASVTPKFSYDQTNLTTFCQPWPESSTTKSQQFTEFDNMLRRSWSNAMSSGCFKYNLDNMKTKVMPGSYKLVIQLNEKRFVQRRKPQEMSSVSQPFDDSKFNFGKVQNKEILFEMCALHRPSSDRNIMIINVSPLEFGNSLLVPSINSRLPQILTVECLELAFETSLLSSHRGFHIGFNSLCAFASVNHLHFHVWYLDYPSPLESISLKAISNDVYEVTNYPTRLFVFLLQDHSEIPRLARKIHKITSHFVDNEVAHNLLIVRGTDEVTDGSSQTTSVRVFLWPRQPVVGAKDESMFNIAVCELGGHLPIRTADQYERITEQDFCEQLKSVTLPNEEFEKLKHFVVHA